MLGYDPDGIRGTTRMMPDKITIHEPKEVEVKAPQQDEVYADAPAVEQEAQEYKAEYAQPENAGW